MHYFPGLFLILYWIDTWHSPKGEGSISDLFPFLLQKSRDKKGEKSGKVTQDS